MSNIKSNELTCKSTPPKINKRSDLSFNGMISNDIKKDCDLNIDIPHRANSCIFDYNLQMNENNLSQDSKKELNKYEKRSPISPVGLLLPYTAPSVSPTHSYFIHSSQRGAGCFLFDKDVLNNFLDRNGFKKLSNVFFLVILSYRFENSCTFT
jgi:hypothetical protein